MSLRAQKMRLNVAAVDGLQTVRIRLNRMNDGFACRPVYTPDAAGPDQIARVPGGVTGELLAV